MGSIKIKRVLQYLVPVVFVLLTAPLAYKGFQGLIERSFTGVVTDKYISTGSRGRVSHTVEFCLIEDRSRCTNVDMRSSSWERVRVGDTLSFSLQSSLLSKQKGLKFTGMVFFVIYATASFLGIVYLLIRGAVRLYGD